MKCPKCAASYRVLGKDKITNICPNCGKRLTIQIIERIFNKYMEQLAGHDRLKAIHLFADAGVPTAQYVYAANIFEKDIDSDNLINKAKEYMKIAAMNGNVDAYIYCRKNGIQLNYNSDKAKSLIVNLELIENLKKNTQLINIYIKNYSAKS